MKQVQCIKMTEAGPSRVMVDEAFFKEQVAQAKARGRECLYQLDESGTGGKSFDQLSRDEQKQVLARQKERAKPSQ